MAKRDKVENKSEPSRYFRARAKAGLLPYRDMWAHILVEANGLMLQEKGVRRGNTKEKANGTYQRPADLTDQNMEQWTFEYIVELLKKYLDAYPDLFTKEPQMTQRILSLMKGRRLLLRQFPDLVAAMFKGVPPADIPEDLRPEENPQPSTYLQEFSEHLESRRRSKAA
jgi:hypothetical protein